MAANTLAPYAAAAIGYTVDHGTNQNETAQAISHFILGGTLAYINGGDPLAGGSAAVAAEKTAQYLAQQYNDGQTAIDPNTGEFNPNMLPEPIKAEIRSVTGAIASVVGATGDGGSVLNAQIAGVVGQNAVENNWLLPHENIRLEEINQLILKAIENGECYEDCGKLITERHRLNETSYQRDEEFNEAYDKCRDKGECEDFHNIHVKLRTELNKKGIADFKEDWKNGYISENWKELPDSKNAFHNYTEDGKSIAVNKNGKYQN